MLGTYCCTDSYSHSYCETGYLSVSEVEKCYICLYRIWQVMFVFQVLKEGGGVQLVEGRKEEHSLSFLNKGSHRIKWLPKISIVTCLKVYMSARSSWQIDPTIGDKSVETLGSKIWFSSVLETFPPLPLKQCWVFYFLDCTDNSAYTTLIWGAGVSEN